MKQLKMICLLITTCMLLYACPDHGEGHYYITFVNKSDREIVCQPFYSGLIVGTDTTLVNTDTLFQCRMGADGISADSLYRYKSSNYSSWEASFRNVSYIHFFVMDAKTYDKYIIGPCDTIRKYVPILHRYQLKLEDLRKMNWTVVYPPEE